jgi:type II secretory pathway component PulL
LAACGAFDNSTRVSVSLYRSFFPPRPDSIVARAFSSPLSASVDKKNNGVSLLASLKKIPSGRNNLF